MRYKYVHRYNPKRLTHPHTKINRIDHVCRTDMDLSQRIHYRMSLGVYYKYPNIMTRMTSSRRQLSRWIKFNIIVSFPSLIGYIPFTSRWWYYVLRLWLGKYIFSLLKSLVQSLWTSAWSSLGLTERPLQKHRNVEYHNEMKPIHELFPESIYVHHMEFH